MGHALVFYIRNKEDEEPIALFSFGGNSDIYTHFRDNSLEFYCGKDGEKYQNFTKEIASELIEDNNNDIKNTDMRLKALSGIINVNSEVMSELISTTSYKTDLLDLKKGLEFLDELRERTEWEGNELLYNSY